MNITYNIFMKFTSHQMLMNTYFTTLPYFIYRQSNKCMDMIYLSDIALTMIHSQNLFWISNIGVIAMLYNSMYSNIYNNTNIVLFSVSSYLYAISFLKIRNLHKMINQT
jgi:hypothetical protein